MLTPTEAKRALKKKAGTLEGAYYAIGVEVPPRQGISFSMRYTPVPSVRAGAQLLCARVYRKKVGMIGELVIAIPHSTHSVSLGGYIRRPGGCLESFVGDANRRALGLGKS